MDYLLTYLLIFFYQRLIIGECKPFYTQCNVTIVIIIQTGVHQMESNTDMGCI